MLNYRTLCFACLVFGAPVGCLSPSATLDGGSSTSQVSQVVGGAGGTISAPDGTSVQIPAGALTSSVTITLTAAPSLAAPSNATWVGTPYSFGPNGTQFAKPVMVTLPFAPNSLPAGATASQVVIYTAAEGSTSYTSLGGTLVDATHVQASTTHFSSFGAGAPSGGAGSSSGATTSGGSTGGSSSGASSSSTGGATSVGASSGGSGPPCISGTLTDLITMNPVEGATLSAVDSSGIPLSGTATISAADGSFEICPPTGVAFTTQITAATYPTTNLESIILATSENLGNIPMLSENSLAALAAFLPGGLVNEEPTLLAQVASKTGACSLAGWSLAAAFADGGSLPDGGALPFQIAYFSATSIPNPSLTSTTSAGLAIIYNIGTPSAQVAITATSSGTCTPENASLGFTGQVSAAGAQLSIAPILLP
jgi:hypothetical protein